MKQIVIVEDETAAAVNLKSLLTDNYPDFTIVAMLESVAETVEWFTANEPPDLLFMDIHLADGNAFSIFKRVELSCPIVFTTAYDQYALEAFAVNSIDYLLKPIKTSDLRRAMDKLSLLTGAELQTYRERVQTMVDNDAVEQSSFLVHVRDKIIPLARTDVAFFYTSNERVVATTLSGESYPIGKSLDTISGRLPQCDFFRANRQFIISRSAVRDMSVCFGSKLCVNLTVEVPERIIVSKARASEFKQWIAGAKE